MHVSIRVSQDNVHRTVPLQYIEALKFHVCDLDLKTSEEVSLVQHKGDAA